MKKLVMAGAAVVLILASAVVVSVNRDRIQSEAAQQQCIPPECLSGGSVGGGTSHLFPEPMQ